MTIATYKLAKLSEESNQNVIGKMFIDCAIYTSAAAMFDKSAS